MSIYYCVHLILVDLCCSDDGWCAFLKHFADSVQSVTGQIVDVRLASETDHSVLQDEIDNLRAKVDELTTEVGLQSFNRALHD